jgi:hypothetical protein
MPNPIWGVCGMYQLSKSCFRLRPPNSRYALLAPATLAAYSLICFPALELASHELSVWPLGWPYAVVCIQRTYLPLPVVGHSHMQQRLTAPVSAGSASGAIAAAIQFL